MAIIEAGFGMLNGQLVVPSRKALMKYVLQRYHIDPRNLPTSQPRNLATSQPAPKPSRSWSKISKNCALSG